MMKKWYFLVIALGIACSSVAVKAQDEGGDAGADAGSDDIGADEGADPGEGGVDEPGAEEADYSPTGQLRGEVAPVIRGMVKTLEAKQYETFLDTFLHPTDKAAMLSQTTLQNAAASFGQSGKADALLGILKSLRQKIPVYSSDGKTAAFVYDSASRSTIKFEKIQGAWYLKN